MPPTGSPSCCPSLLLSLSASTLQRKAKQLGNSMINKELHTCATRTISQPVVSFSFDNHCASVAFCTSLPAAHLSPVLVAGACLYDSYIMRAVTFLAPWPAHKSQLDARTSCTSP